MPLVLLDLASRKSSRVTRPKPVRCEDGRVAIVLAPIYPGWFVVPVEDTPEGVTLFRNDEPVAHITRLSYGDRLEIGQRMFEVEGCTGDQEAATTPPVAPSAIVVVRSSNRIIAEGQVVRAGVIGTAETSAVVVPVETGLATHHAVLAHVEGRWHLLVLDSAGASRLRGEPAFSLPLVHGESVWLNDQVEITLNCEELDPLDLVAATAERGDGRATRTTRAAVAVAPVVAESVTTAGEETPASVSMSLVEGSSRRMTRVTVDAGNPVHVAAKVLCDRIQALHSRIMPSLRATPVIARPFKSLSPPINGTVGAVEQLGHEVESAPWEPGTLFAVASYLRQLGLNQFSMWVLKELRRQNPTDPVVNESIGVIYMHQAADTTRDIKARIEDMKQANKYLTIAFNASSHNGELSGLLKKVGAELTLMQLP